MRTQSELSRTQQSKLLLSAETWLGLKMTRKCRRLRHDVVASNQPALCLISVPSLLQANLSWAGVLPVYNTWRKIIFESANLSGPLERFFGCQRQRGGVHDNLNVQEFTKNTQALQVINSMSKGPSKGNCRGGHEDKDTEKENHVEPLPKCPRKKSNINLLDCTNRLHCLFCDCVLFECWSLS